MYWLTPPYNHVDLGFGLMADSYKEAANRLKSTTASYELCSQSSVPICFLKRHAIELYLKSLIIILRVTYNELIDDDHPDEINLFKSTKKINIFNTHQISELYDLYNKQIHPHLPQIQDQLNCQWTIPEALEEWIKTIDSYDRTGFYFRYPQGKDINNTDTHKSYMKQVDPNELGSKLSKKLWQFPLHNS